MSELRNLRIADFLKAERINLEKLEREILLIPSTYEQRIDLLEKPVKRALKFGIQTGVLLEQARNARVEKAKEVSINRYVDELIFTINHKLAEYRNNPKVKYSKRKYRKRKQIMQEQGGIQLIIPFSY